MVRPFKAQWYPYAQAIALIIAFVAMVSMIIFNLFLAGVYLGLLVLGYLWYFFFVTETDRNKALEIQE